MFDHHQPIIVAKEMYQHYLHECDVVDCRLVPFEQRDLLLKQPTQRLFVHQSFSIEAFNQLSKTYLTPIFQCYSRLLSFNTDFYCSNYGLINYEFYAQTIGSNRDLNDHEKKFFKPSTFFQMRNDPNYQVNLTFVSNFNEFRKNFDNRFSSVHWIDAIDFSKFLIVGGSVINALCQSPFIDTREQDINLIYPSAYPIEFEAAVMKCIDVLQNITSQYSKHQIIIEKTPGKLRFDIHLPCGVKLNFLYITCLEHRNNSLSSILDGFDIDLCQIAYTGS
ncbi:unnamed protein product [Adineta steineri]|nr:unnamed protein product [Adineta steineri]CAF4201125.1 unnamed protein product [Adineta steineri]